MAFEFFSLLAGPVILALGLFLMVKSAPSIKDERSFRMKLLKIHMSGCLMASGAMIATIKGVDMTGLLENSSLMNVPLLIFSAGIAAYAYALSSIGTVRRKDAGVNIIYAQFPTALSAALPLAFYAIIS